jgi:peroxiredoxin
VSLAEFRGSVVFLNFWATWCVPCKEEMPAMERLHRRFKDQGLAVLAVSADADGAQAVAPFVRQHRLTFTVVLDPRMTVAGLYSVWALPSTFIIDRQGRQVYFASGPREWDGPAAASLFESLLRR